MKRTASADVKVQSVLYITAKPARLRTSIIEAWRTRDLATRIAARDLGTKYHRSLIGWGWSLINPITTTLVYVFVFSVIFKTVPEAGRPSGNHYFPVFLLAGILPWSFLANSLNQGTAALIGAGGIMSKASFSREHIVTGTVLALLVTTCVEFAVLVLACAALGYPVFSQLASIALLLVLLGCFALGLSLFVAALNIRYRDVQHLTGVVLQVWFYLTPIVYPVSRIPRGDGVVNLRVALLCNPMARFVLAFRRCFYDGSGPSFFDWVWLSLLAILTLGLGYLYFTRRSDRFVEDL